MKKTQISFNVELDENQIPEKISWSATDGGFLIKILKQFFYQFGITNLKKL